MSPSAERSTLGARELVPPPVRHSLPDDRASPVAGAIDRLTFRAIVRRYKAASAVAFGLVLALIAVVLAAAASGPSTTPLSDATSCSQWAAATATQQTAYGYLYLREYGDLLSSARAARGVRSTLDVDCAKAADLGDSDEVTVVAAIKHEY
jgi:Flp pilus assembly pilin Flp